jgi:hypothetical protein
MGTGFDARQGAANLAKEGRMTNDQILERIARFHFPKGPVIAERRNRGYTLFHANTGTPIARLRHFGPDDRVELL